MPCSTPAEANGVSYKFLATAPTYYDLVTSGASCSAARSDCEAIFYKEECKRAAIELQLSDTDTGSAHNSDSY
ncbi:hypothetical protein CYMTET_30695, partial [Cymbomonas tetramitiformis]